MSILLGPPNTSSSTTTSPSTSPPPQQPFMSLMTSNFNTLPPIGLTENNSYTFLSSGDPLLDFFFQVVPNTPTQTLTTLLESSWASDPLTTLKLICHLRGIRGTGKSDKDSFYTSALWLHKNHPKTLAFNLPAISQFGYLKDPLEILYRLMLGPDVRRINRQNHPGRYRKRMPMTRKVKRRKKNDQSRKATCVVVPRREKRVGMARRVLERYGSDEEFRRLHDSTADLFAGLLVKDMEIVGRGEKDGVSLAAKWCPSLDSSFDTCTLICESIARRVFTRERCPEYVGVEDEHYAYRVRDRLRKEILVPLRKLLELPEVYMSSNQWNILPYNRVASVAMKNYKPHFIKHDKTRFSEYLSEVRSGTTTIAAGALLPHEIIASIPMYKFYHPYLEGQLLPDDSDEVAELQWIRMVKDLSSKGKLSNSIAVCDVSGSMNGEPMEVCIALGLLISELSDEPWKGHVITFSDTPTMHKIVGDRLLDKVSFVRDMNWGFNTDFQKVFDQILKVAVEGNLAPKDMIKTIFVFSDMEFDQARGASVDKWETDYMVIERKFRECGYGEAIPEMVFWNLRDSQSTPVAAEQKGVALVSGFSKNMMKVFMEEGRLLTPRDVMRAAISGQEYQGLKVYD